MTLGAYRNNDGKIAITANSGADEFFSHTDRSFTQVEVVESTVHVRSFWSSLGRLLDEEDQEATGNGG